MRPAPQPVARPRAARDGMKPRIIAATASTSSRWIPAPEPCGKRTGVMPSGQTLRRLTLALALLWLALGYANVVRGTAHLGPRYRFWSFQHLCYSDVIAMHGDRYLGGGHPRPYLDDRIEYPVLLGVFLWLPHWVPGGALAHFTVTYLLLALCLLAALAALERTPGARAVWLGATPALVLFAPLNWDLLPIALLAVAALALSRGREVRAGAWTGLGICAKLFPGVLVLPALGALAAGPAEPGARSRRRRILGLLVALGLVIAAVNLPVALAAPERWAWFFVFNGQRGAENSLWSALHLGKGPLLEALSAGPLLVASAFSTWAAARAATRGDGQGRDVRAVRLGAALTLVVWIATNKIWSPQYALYGFLAGALAAAPLSLFGVLSAASFVDYWAEFEVRGRRWEPAFRDLVFQPVNLARTVLWLALALWIGRELLRESRRPGTLPLNVPLPVPGPQ